MIKDLLAEEIGISDAHLEEIRNFAQKYPTIEKVILYGSRAKGTFKPGSDLDLVIVGDQLEFKDQLNFSGDLDDSYQPYFFDVAILSYINNEALLDHIRRVGKVIYEKNR
ncbi:nucleotidyltransferase domain-containing protein [Algoriphagus sp. Y33]|uniref:nucleotidyltransferase domain-containing protein n=1 Tax=Algoriphagus sp. Y33 TaxID=2772483 RepID=UPI001784F790|nr:nucleotidyltransferase domain-containing protein [Algoriphagus sp. Y33]